MVDAVQLPNHTDRNPAKHYLDRADRVGNSKSGRHPPRKVYIMEGGSLYLICPMPASLYDLVWWVEGRIRIGGVALTRLALLAILLWEPRLRHLREVSAPRRRLPSKQAVPPPVRKPRDN